MSPATTGATDLAGRYATAVFELAEADGVLDGVADDLGRLGRMIAENDDLSRAIRSPVAAREDQVRAMTTIMEKTGMGDLSTRFVAMVAGNRRLFALAAMISAYRERVARHRGDVSASVVSAAALSDRQLKALAASLKAALGVTVSVDTHVDPGLLGGLRVRVGSKLVDGSLSGKLQRLRFAMKGVG